MVERNSPTNIELTLSTKELNTTRSSACELSIYDTKISRFVEYDKTEFSTDENNPKWKKKILINYIFSLQQDLRFTIVESDQTIGEVFCKLSDLVPKKKIEFSLSGNNRYAKLVVLLREIKKETQKLTLQFRAHNVDKKDFFGKSDPYLLVFKKTEDGSWTKVYKSEIIKNTFDPFWKPFEISSDDLCESNSDWPIKIECWDWDRNWSDDFIGFVEVSLHQLLVANARFSLIHPAKLKKSSKYQNSGILEVVKIQAKKNLSFIDFLQSGTQLNLSVCIDFTSSNLEFSNKNSAHYFDDNFQNEYERSIISIGNIIEAYDDDKLFAIFGFGGEPNWTKRVENSFAINKNNQSPYIHTIQNVIKTYHSVLPNIKLAGPRLFQNILRTGISISQSTNPGEIYYVFLILTNGEIFDLSQTISGIIESSYLPISIVIVGVGLSNFENLEPLLVFPLKDESGRQSARQNVQFIPFRSVGGNPILLAKNILDKIPSQFLEYMNLIRYEPQNIAENSK